MPPIIAVGTVFWGATAHALEQESLFLLSIEELLAIEVETRKTKESYSSVPMSNSVYSNEFLLSHNINDLYQLAEYVPNLSYRPSFGKLQERGVIRGIANATGENVTGFFIDGMSITGLINGLDLQDYKYVDIIKGPQAALYGRTTFAGAVNLVSYNPLDKLFNQASISTTDRGKSRAKVKYGTSITKHSAIQFNASFLEKAGQYHNQLGDGGGTFDQQSQSSLTLHSAYENGDTIANLHLGYNREDDSGYPVMLQGAEYNNCFLDTPRQYYCGDLLAPNAYGVNQTFLNEQSFSGYRNLSTWVKATLQRSWHDQHEATLNVAVLDAEQRYFVDGDYSPFPFIWVDVKNTWQTHEVELKLSSQWSSTWSTLIGLVHYNQQSNGDLTRHLSIGNDILATPPRIDESKIDNFAAYLSAHWQLMENTGLSFDIRLAEDAIAFATPSQEGKATFQSVSPKLTVRHNLDPENMLYASVANGTKPGGFNNAMWDQKLDAVIDQDRRERLRTFEQEGLWQVETGIKGKSVDNLLSYHASVYLAKWQDLQTSQSVFFQNSDGSSQNASIISNEGAANTAGMELELQSQVTSQTQYWAILGLAHSEYVDSATAAQSQLMASGDISGNRIPNVPEKTFAMGFNYQAPLGNWEMQYLISLHHESDRYVAEHNLAQIPEVNKLKLGILGRFKDWQLSIHSSIAEHASYVESAARFGDPATGFRLRTFGLSLSDKNSTEFKATYQF